MQKIFKGSGTNRKELHVVKLWQQISGEGCFLDPEGNYRMFGENNELITDREYGHICIQPPESHDRALFDAWFTELYGDTEKSRQRAEAEAEARASVRYKRQKGSYKPSTCKKWEEVKNTWFEGTECPSWWGPSQGKQFASKVQIGNCTYTRCSDDEE